MSIEVVTPPPSPKRLSPLQERAIAALLTAPTHEAAARTACVSANTLWRYLRLPEFQAAYRNARRESMKEATAQLQRLSAGAVQALGAVAADEAATPTSRVSAAKAILEMGYRAMEADDFSARLEALEALNQELMS